METIQALGSPTINEFASFMRISPPNAAYKINSLIRKGYIQKIQSEHGQAGSTPAGDPEVQRVLQHQQRLCPCGHRADERAVHPPTICAKLEEMLTIISKELMPEVRLGSAEA